MNLQKRLFLSVGLMGAAALMIGILCLQSSRALFENQAKVYNSGLSVYHLKKVSDAYALDVIGAVQKTRNGEAWAWEEGGKVLESAWKTADEHWKAYMAMDQTKDEKYLATIVNASLDNNKHLMEQLKDAFANKDARNLEILATSVLYPSIEPITDNLRKLEDLNEKMGRAAVDQAEKGFTGSFNFMALAVVLLLAAGLFSSLWVGTWALRPLGALNRSWEGLVEQVASLAAQVASGTAQLASGVAGTAGQARKAGGAVDQALTLNQNQGRETNRTRNLLEETEVSLSASGESAEQTAVCMKKLHQNAEKVFQVVKTIEEIAFQTNILALNAGVEAVRAGEQGKEFVVVVEEIRNLSQRCAQVAKETSQLVTENARQTSEGLRFSEAAQKSIVQTAEKAKKVSGLLTVMEEGAGDQADGLQNLRSLMAEVEGEAYRNGGWGEKANSTGSLLAKQVESLKIASRQFASFVQGEGKESASTGRSAGFKPAVPSPAAQSTAPAGLGRDEKPAERPRVEAEEQEERKIVRMAK